MFGKVMGLAVQAELSFDHYAKARHAMSKTRGAIRVNETSKGWEHCTREGLDRVCEPQCEPRNPHGEQRLSTIVTYLSRHCMGVAQ